MNDPREIRITLTRDEFVAVQTALSGTLEEATEQDWEAGLFDDLDAAQGAFNRAWHRYMRRHQQAVR